MEIVRGQTGAGVYFEKHLASQENVNKFLMGILLFVVNHGVAVQTVDCLIKTCKKHLPDSLILKDVKSMKKSSATYHIKHGLAKTEEDITIVLQGPYRSIINDLIMPIIRVLQIIL